MGYSLKDFCRDETAILKIQRIFGRQTGASAAVR
jgi:hypothetical protein